MEHKKETNMEKHGMWMMALCCGLPLLLALILPLLGFQGNYNLIIVVVMLLGCVLMMLLMHRYGGKHDKKGKCH